MTGGVKNHTMAARKPQLRGGLDKGSVMNTLWLLVAVLAVFSFALDRWLTVYDKSKGHLV
jgi:hypothetical protein